MSDADFTHLAELHALGDDAIPAALQQFAAGVDVELVWRNELGGLTFRVGDRFVKWNSRSAPIDLRRERERLEWASSRHPVPAVVGWDEDETAQWMVLPRTLDARVLTQVGRTLGAAIIAATPIGW